MFKKLLALVAILFATSSVASDMDLVIASYQNEDGAPVRFQHVYHHDLVDDWLTLKGIHNLDMASDWTWTRIQVKPRLLLTAYETNGFSFNAVYQYEFFDNRRVQRQSNRLGAGVEYRYKTFNVEVNYYPYDSLEDARGGTPRWDSYVNFRYGKWGFNNQFWYVPEWDRHYEQATISYTVWKNVAIQYQRQWLTGADDLTRFGISARFK